MTQDSNAAAEEEKVGWGTRLLLDLCIVLGVTGILPMLFAIVSVLLGSKGLAEEGIPLAWHLQTVLAETAKLEAGDRLVVYRDPLDGSGEMSYIVLDTQRVGGELPVLRLRRPDNTTVTVRSPRQLDRLLGAAVRYEVAHSEAATFAAYYYRTHPA